MRVTRAIELVFGCLCVIFVMVLSISRPNAFYDKSINIFSPEGELLQAKYANEAAQRGNPCICLPIRDKGILVCTLEGDTEEDVLLDRKLLDKIEKVDDTAWVTFSGLAGDGRAIIRYTRSFCAGYRLKYGCSPSLAAIAKAIADMQHKTTLSGTERPLGAHVLVFGFNEGMNAPTLFSIRPTGHLASWKAYCIGRGCDCSLAWLEKEYKIPESIDDAVTLALSALRKTTDFEKSSSIRSRPNKIYLKYFSMGSHKRSLISTAVISENATASEVQWSGDISEPKQ